MHRTQDWLLNCIHQVCWIFVPRYHMRLVPPRMKLKGSCRMWRFRYGGRRPHVLSHVITCLHILHIWSLKESVACDDSDTEAEGKMSSHAITKARSLLLWSWKKAVACDDFRYGGRIYSIQYMKSKCEHCAVRCVNKMSIAFSLKFQVWNTILCLLSCVIFPK